MSQLRFLLLEDSPLDAELIRATLEGEIDFDLTLVQNRPEFLTALDSQTFDLILSDYSLPNFDGISALEVAQARCPEVPFILVSATLGEELAIEALKDGATDYVLKQRLNRLVPSVKRALREAQERRDRQLAQREKERAEVERDRFFCELERTYLTLQSLIESCPLAVIFFDTNGIVKLWNRAAEEITGWNADEVVGRFLPTVPHRHDDFLANLRSVLRGKSLSGLEVTHIHKDGHTADLAVWMTLISQADGSPGCLCIATDITERKRHENERDQAVEALRQSEARFKRLVEFNLIGCMFWDIHGNILEANDAFLHMLGYTRAELDAGQLRWKDITPPEQIVLSEQSISKMLATGVADTVEKEYIRKNGTRISVLLGGVMFENSREQGVSFVVDLSERKRSEQVLQEHNQRLKLLFETTSDLLLTDQPLALLNNLFNKLAAQMDLHCYCNFLIDKSHGQPILKLKAYGGIPPEAVAEINQIDIGQYMCGLVAQERCQIILSHVQQSNHPNAEIIRSLGINAYAGQPLIAQGRLLGTLSFASKTRESFTDEEAALLQAASDQVAIALERAELVASLQQQTERLTQVNRVKDEFLAVLSHELRTPLNPILGWSRILQAKRCDDATMARALETIERNARIQTQLIDDLLDVSRILQGKLNLHISQVELVSIMEAAFETVRLAAEAKRLNVSFEIQERSIYQPSQEELAFPTSLKTSSYRVLGDPARLQQVVWNLLSNAVKFTPVDGRISVSLSAINEVSEETLGNADEFMLTNDNLSRFEYAQIQITDTGNGISPDFLPYVFEYFRQADGSTTRTFGGLGLGLAIAKHIVQAHGGVLQAFSKGEGQGATFTLRLPLLQDESDKLLKQSNSLSSSLQVILPPNLQVLVVDDERDSLELIAFLLEQGGAKVSVASSASEALLVLEKFNPDILISDIGMPKEDGYSLLRKVRNLAVNAKKNIPAIALTAYARDEDRNRAYAAGFQKYLPKPIDPSNFIATVVELTGQMT